MKPKIVDAAVREAAISSTLPAQFDAVASLVSTSDCRSYSTAASLDAPRRLSPRPVGYRWSNSVLLPLRARDRRRGEFRPADYGILVGIVARMVIDRRAKAKLRVISQPLMSDVATPRGAASTCAIEAATSAIPLRLLPSRRESNLDSGYCCQAHNPKVAGSNPALATTEFAASPHQSANLRVGVFALSTCLKGQWTGGPPPPKIAGLAVPTATRSER